MESPSDQTMGFDVGSIDISDEELPKIKDSDVIPLEYLNYIRKKAYEFLNSID